MKDLDIDEPESPLGISIEKVSAFYGNRRTVVFAFLTDKAKHPEVLTESKLNVFELIELQLGYPVPIKIRKKVKN